MPSPIERKRRKALDDGLVCRQAGVRRQIVRAAVAVLRVEEEIERGARYAHIEDDTRKAGHVVAALPVAAENFHLARESFDDLIERRRSRKGVEPLLAYCWIEVPRAHE